MAEAATDLVFARSEAPVRALADALIAAVSAWPEVRIEPKQGSIHLCRKSAFAGLHPRKRALLVNLRTDAPIEAARIRRTEQVSAHRFHNELLVEPSQGLDAELAGWLDEAYRLAG